ncbi:hypothetical protein PIB30_080288 [Stylosanthes scabra]|uniref:DUF4283 domain-containing protein n=1 Tax=Stylosanthes scabra TaxID=79078 RepID=A0ABU6SSM8_9FABA|nr:hypothetical protein [Stylosanthes scabra]
MDEAMSAIWGKPEGFRVMEINTNLFQFFFAKDSDVFRIEAAFLGCSRVLIGSINAIDFFEVKGRESRILKAYVEIDGSKVVKDYLKLAAPNGPQVEDSAENQIKQDCIGEWVKASQVSKRLARKEGLFADNRTSSGGIVPQPRKKPPPTWLLKGFSGLSMKESSDDTCSKSGPALQLSQHGSAEDHMRCLNNGDQSVDSVLKEIPPSNNVAVVFSTSANNSSQLSTRVKLKQIVRHKGSLHKSVSGQKRRNGGKENSANWKKLCMSEICTAENKVEGASREMAPTGP